MKYLVIPKEESLITVDSVNNMIQIDRMYRGHVEQILNNMNNTMNVYTHHFL